MAHRHPSTPVSRNLIVQPTPENNPHTRPVTPTHGTWTPPARTHTKNVLRGSKSMWHSLSPYYSNAFTIDRRWDR